MSRRGVLLSCLVGMVLSAGCPSQSSTPPVTGEHGTMPSSGAAAYLPEGAVLPTPETIESGKYTPLSRPLFLYVTRAALKKPETVAFLRFYLSETGRELVGETGYLRLTPEEYARQVAVLEEAVKAAGIEVGPKLNGQVLVDGSSTVAPITTAVAEEFHKVQPEVRVPVGTSGTGGGFKKFCHGETDISNASRPIKESEIELCRQNKIEYIELKIAIDGLTVVVNPKNTWVDGLSVAELKQIWGADSKVKKWSDINPSFPNAEIKLFGPDTDSGTFDYFTEEICGGKGASRSDYQQSADDNFLVTGVAGDVHALGYFGYAYYVENQEKLKALAIAP